MNRASAEKIANAIVAQARRAGIDQTGRVTVTVTNVAAALKQRPADVSHLILLNGAAIWGCLPIGWRFAAQDAETLMVDAGRVPA